MRKAREHYTEAEDAVIAVGWAAGDSVVEIAERLGRTPGSVAAYASKHGLISHWSLGTTVAARFRRILRSEEKSLEGARFAAGRNLLSNHLGHVLLVLAWAVEGNGDIEPPVVLWDLTA